jgi:predicted GNAT family N-acyltransferase
VDWQLYTIYTLASVHGLGAGQQLAQRVLGDRAAIVWLAAENPRARAFYRKIGFVEDGTTLNDDGLEEIRMARRAVPVA